MFGKYLNLINYTALGELLWKSLICTIEKNHNQGNSFLKVDG